MDVRNQAGLILHELVYRHAVDQGYLDSRTARLLNAHINSTTFTAQPADAFVELLISLVLDPSTFFTSSTGAIRWSPWESGGELNRADAIARCATRGFVLEYASAADRGTLHTSELGRKLADKWIWAQDDLGYGRNIAFRYSTSVTYEVFEYARDPSELLPYLCVKTK